MFAYYTVTSVINRYYDPVTDQFLSLDPYVALTDQPYGFVNDDPLNSSDPSGFYAISGTGESAFVTQTTAKDGVKKTTVIVTAGSSKPVKVSISTSVVKVPVGMGFTLSVSASATVSHSASQPTPSLDVGSDGSVSVTANGVSASALNGEPLNTTFGIDIPGGSSSQTIDVAGDQVTTTISASLSYTPQDSPLYFSVNRGLEWDGAAAAGAAGLFVWFFNTFGKLAPAS